VVLTDDNTMAIMQEIVRCGAVDKVHIGMDFFDASINRIFAWAIGMRAARKSLLCALLDPIAMMRKAENEADYGTRLALMEEARSLPFNTVWEEYCARSGKLSGMRMLESVKKYEAKVLSKRQ
ncbi:MAG: L-rhamnose isomerase, partial [Opitutales bacterium]|nr:L-rhamnose isomerase [Opitutales bacterium]